MYTLIQPNNKFDLGLSWRVYNNQINLTIQFDKYIELSQFLEYRHNPDEKIVYITLPYSDFKTFIKLLIAHQFVSLNDTVKTNSEEISVKQFFDFDDILLFAPPPPIEPHLKVKGYHVDGYLDLINSLEKSERILILEELESREIQTRADLLAKELLEDQIFELDLKDTRQLFLAALLLLQQNKISKAQLASLHILDAAIRTLYTDLHCYLKHETVQNGQLTKQYHTFPILNNQINRIHRLIFNTQTSPPSLTKGTELREKADQPLMRQFFNLTETEWQQFYSEVLTKPFSERYFYALAAPAQGCWSNLIFLIQSALTCMQVLEWQLPYANNWHQEKFMIIPSFSMFQIAVNVKSASLGRRPLTLVPTYYYLSEEQYYASKIKGEVPVSLYLPERQPWLRYKSNKYRGSIDGHPDESSFAGILHDIYHALRELQMAENISDARWRLVLIAKNHPKNKKTPESRAITEILTDGELIFSNPHQPHLFFDKRNSTKAECFGDLFHTNSMRQLDNDLKRAFINDMVTNKEAWLENFKLGRGDLLEGDQQIYDEMTRTL